MISLDKYNNTELERTSYNQTVNGPYSDLWKEGIQQELDALHLNNMWDVVPILVGQNIVGSKWVFKLKHDAGGNINCYMLKTYFIRTSSILLISLFPNLIHLLPCSDCRCSSLFMLISILYYIQSCQPNVSCFSYVLLVDIRWSYK